MRKLFIIFSLYLPFFMSCSKDKINTPIVETIEPYNITHNTFMVGGRIVSDNGYAITEKGFCFGNDSKLTIENSITTNYGAGNEEYYDYYGGLFAGTVYYVRAYAVNEQGVAYGKEFKVITSNPPTN